jgi:hypothetical protein
MLLKMYNNSPYMVLSAVYPEHEWLPWKFLVTPKETWKDAGNIKKVFNWLGKELGVKEISDWKNISKEVPRIFDFMVTRKDIISLVGYSLFSSKSLPQLLELAYPEYNWEGVKFTTPYSKKSQYLLKTHLKNIFTNTGNVFYNF